MFSKDSKPSEAVLTVDPRMLSLTDGSFATVVSLNEGVPLPTGIETFSRQSDEPDSSHGGALATMMGKSGAESS